MTDKPSANINETLRLGIQAARAGQDKKAREYFVAVLKQSPDHIPAMLWLAFVLPNPRDTIRVLERVLALDPVNERAQAGLRWAESRLAEPPAPVSSSAPPASAAETIRMRRHLLSEQRAEQAKKGAAAQRARRNFRPILLVLIMLGVVGLALVSLAATTLTPAHTLAAWRPVPAPAAPLPAPAPVRSVQSDTLPAAIFVDHQPDPLQPPLLAAPPPAAEAEPPAAVPPELPAVDYVALVGPVSTPDLPGFEIMPPVDNLTPVHQPAYPGEKWIEVNVTTQQVIAWEGNVPVFAFTVSTGLPNTPTVLGEYHIYWKLESGPMSGPGYYLPDVPYTMYFYGGYALHGTYWHNNFGQPMSHGCVNLHTDNAKKLFEWADPVVPPGLTQIATSATGSGTLVVIHE